MADYNITFPDGTPLLIQQGTINNVYDLPLTGQDAINYGDDFATAYIRLLSSFANTSAPAFGTTRKAGQLWFDTTPITGGLNVFDGVSWDSIAFDANVVHTSGAETIGGIKTFSDSPAFVSSGSPFTVNSPILVENLNVEFLNGSADTAFATAFQGQLADQAEPDLLNPSMSGYILSSLTDGTRSWIAPTSGTGNIDPVDITDISVLTPAAMSVILSDDPTGDQPPVTESGLTFDGTTNTLITTTFQGNLQGTADSATVATTATSATTAQQINVSDTESASTNVVVVNGATGDLIPLTDEELLYNANTGTLTSTIFSGSGESLTNLSAANISSGVLAVLRGGTGVTTSTGSGSAVVLHTAPTFVTRISTDQVRDAGSTGVTIQWNNASKLRTVDQTATDKASGADVRDGSNVYRPVGFNVIPNTNQSGATTSHLDQARVGYSLRGTNSSGTKTYKVGQDTTIPDGATWIVKNLTTSSGVVIVTSDSGVTLRWMDGSGSPQTDVSGASPFSLARGGVATVHKITDTEFEMWGIGIS
jgi:hypothetical protein